MAGDGETLGMNSRRVSALLVFMLAAVALALTGCQTERRTHAPAAASRSAVMLLLISETGNLTAEQLQSHRDEVVRYVTERGLLAPDDVLVNDLAAADRIIRAVIGDSGGFKLSVFEQGGRASRDGETRRVYWLNTSPDPFFDAGYYYRDGPNAGYIPYIPRELPRSRNPNAPPPNQPRPNNPPATNPPTNNPPTTNPPATQPPRHRHDPNPSDKPDQPRPPHRPHVPDNPSNTPRPPREHPTPPPPRTYTPPPASTPPKVEPARPAAPRVDERRDDTKPPQER